MLQVGGEEEGLAVSVVIAAHGSWWAQDIKCAASVRYM